MDISDIVEIQQLLALYGHAADADDESLLPQVFSEDAVFDTSALGGFRLEGLPAITAGFIAGKPWYPPSHNTTNPYVFERDGETRGLSKWLFVNAADGSIVLGDYADRFVRTDKGWRLADRLVTLRHPLAK